MVGTSWRASFGKRHSVSKPVQPGEEGGVRKGSRVACGQQGGGFWSAQGHDIADLQHKSLFLAWCRAWSGWSGVCGGEDGKACARVELQRWCIT